MDPNSFNLPYRRKMLYRRKRRRQIILTTIIGISIVLPILLTITSNMKNNNKIIATIYNKPNLIKDESFKVCIDAGHGEWDAGTVGINGTKEKDIDLKVALKLGALLKAQGIDVMYTRTTDSQKGILTANDSLKERLKISKVFKANIFVSIHCNSNLNSKETKGVETWYKPESIDGQTLATLLQNQLSAVNYTTNRGIKSYDNKDDALAVLEKNTSTSALVELGFLSNKDDEYYLNSELGQNTCANALLKGILEYKESLSNN